MRTLIHSSVICHTGGCRPDSWFLQDKRIAPWYWSARPQGLGPFDLDLDGQGKYLIRSGERIHINAGTCTTRARGVQTRRCAETAMTPQVLFAVQWLDERLAG